MLKLLLPVMAMIYWISPIDLIPLFPLDDLVIVAVALRMFVSLAQGPDAAPNTGADGKQNDGSNPSSWQSNGQANNSVEDDSIMTTWRVVDDDES